MRHHTTPPLIIENFEAISSPKGHLLSFDAKGDQMKHIREIFSLAQDIRMSLGEHDDLILKLDDVDCFILSGARNLCMPWRDSDLPTVACIFSNPAGLPPLARPIVWD